MRTIKTNLAGKSNAVLTDFDDDNVIAIITCGKSENITKKIQTAIARHFNAKDFEKDHGEQVLDNLNPIYFGSVHIEDGLESARDFKLEIVPTY